MSSLYSDLASVYEAMYHTFIDYEDEFELYYSLLSKYHKEEVLEIGCGTGNLAPYFMNKQMSYKGFDLSEAMIEIAKVKVPTAPFILGDMRQFKLPAPVQSTIITARTISYLISNQDVSNTFKSINHNLPLNGILCFDAIDANRFVPMIDTQSAITHEASYQGIDYVRKSKWQFTNKVGIDYDWSSTYYQKTGKDLVELGQDNTSLRTFTKDEISIFLSRNGFELLEAIDRPSYFFPTFVFVAKKIKSYED